MHTVVSNNHTSNKIFHDHISKKVDHFFINIAQKYVMKDTEFKHTYFSSLRLHSFNDIFQLKYRRIILGGI